MSRFVRSSKYRHVFGTVAKKEECFDDLRLTRTAWDSNYAAAGAQYFATILEAGGGGAFIVLPYSAGGKVPASAPSVTGHKGPVLDLDFNPFNDSLVASCSEDATIKIWGIPEGGLTQNLVDPLQNLTGHKRKVGSVKFNPVANNILATTSTDYSVKIWDIEKGKSTLSIDAQHTDIIQSADWNRNGSLLITSCKDKKVRLLDPRQQKVIQEVEAHGGIKGSRAIFLGMDKIFTAGFTKSSEREICIWDARNLTNKLAGQSVDSASGLLMPFFDEDTGTVFVGGKGDGNIRYYEVVDDATQLYYLSEFKSNTPQRGLCTLPKRALNISDCEIVRMLKVGVKLVEPISFQVPRKGTEVFQDDIYPDAFSGEPALSADEWLGGSDSEPKKVSLASGFVKKPSAAFNPEKQDAPKELSEKEVRAEYEKLKLRVAYLEAEIIKKDAKIKELEKA